MGGAAVRIFLALPLPQDVRADIGHVLKRLREKAPDVRWVKPEQLHITLIFIGEAGERAAAEISAISRVVCSSVPAMRLVCSGIDHFGPPSRPRVVHIPVTGGAEKCGALQLRLAESLTGRYPAEKRSYNAHITLGRVRKGTKADPESWKEESALIDFSFPVTECVLYRSVLERDGAVYNKIAAFPFRV
jgi:2'-5' RNA ligase